MSDADSIRARSNVSTPESVLVVRALLSGPSLRRFIERIRVADSCWEWLGDQYSNGYGRFSLGDAEWLVHRLAYACMVGPIPVDLTIDHLCNNRLCVNPNHLAIATRAENARRGDGSPKPTHCPQGHEYARENVRHNTDGSRHCRACDRERARKKRFRDPEKCKASNRRSYLKHKEKYLERRRIERTAEANGE